jgi:hypothetical protein
MSLGLALPSQPAAATAIVLGLDVNFELLELQPTSTRPAGHPTKPAQQVPSSIITTTGYSCYIRGVDPIGQFVEHYVVRGFHIRKENVMPKDIRR